MTQQLCSSLAFLGSTPVHSEPGGPDMTRYALVCLLLLALIAGAAYGFRRFIASAVRTRASKRSLQVVDLLPLGGKQRLCVVRCYDRTFALGLGDKEVALIAELDAPATLPAKPALPFAALLKREEQHAGDPAPEVPARRKRSLFPAGSLFG